MRILAFESSAKAASVALLTDGILTAESYQNDGQTHSRTMMQLAKDLLDSCALSPADLDLAAWANGPGSFTGVRIGAAAAKGLCWGAELPCVPVSTLEAMAWNAVDLEGVICCCMDARRSQVYNALFRGEGGKIVRLRPDRAVSLEELAEDLKNFSEPVWFVGDGAVLCFEALGAELANTRIVREKNRQQRASGVALAAYEAALQGVREDPGIVVPNYLRLSQAERERLERNKEQNENKDEKIEKGD